MSKKYVYVLYESVAHEDSENLGIFDSWIKAFEARDKAIANYPFPYEKEDKNTYNGKSGKGIQYDTISIRDSAFVIEEVPLNKYLEELENE